MNLKETPIPSSEADNVIPVYSQPFLPVSEDRYLTSVNVVLKNGDVFVLSGAEWIHPEGHSMGKVDISTQTHMISLIRMSKVKLLFKGEKNIAGVMIYLKDGGAYILSEGDFQSAKGHVNDGEEFCFGEEFLKKCQKSVYWTIQHKDVIEVLNKQGTYYPDFEKSPQVHRDTYDKLLGVYNELNNTTYKGLIFCIAKDGRTDKSLTFRDETDFIEYMKARPKILNSLNNGAYSLLDNSHLLCRFETDKFNQQWLCTVDFWNFILMFSNEDGMNELSYEMRRSAIPALADYSYDEFVKLSWEKMRKRKVVYPLMSSTIFQENIPYLERDMLKGTYSLEALVNV